MYWDGEATPSVEVPLGDFFCNGWCERCNITSLPVAVNPAGGFNSYWEMPFRKHARITVENLSPDDLRGFYYQITYTLTEVPDDARLLPRPVAAQQPAALQAGPHPARRRARAGPVRRHLPGLGRATTTAGGARARSSSTWTATASGRPSAAPAPRTTSAAPGTSSSPQGQYGVFSTPRTSACRR